MKLFGRTSGYYLFWTGFVYFWTGIYLAVTHIAPPEFATLGFALVLSVPLWCPPVARYFNMEPFMFDWFKKADYSNVVKFPESKVIPPMPYVEPTELKTPEKDPVTFYSIGPTDNNRVNLKMGYSSITMNKAGVQSMINMLTTAMNQLTDEDEEE
jgi:hypothetical protein